MRGNGNMSNWNNVFFYYLYYVNLQDRYENKFEKIAH